MGDAVLGAHGRQQARADGFSPEASLARVHELSGRKIGACGGCLSSRGLAGEDLPDWCSGATLDDLADATE